MAARQMKWAHRLRRKIMRELGPECAGYKKECGATEKLELDCIKPVGNGHGKWSYDTRIRFYRDQLKQDNLQVLCNKCHEKKSAHERRKNANHPELPYDNEPF